MTAMAKKTSYPLRNGFLAAIAMASLLGLGFWEIFWAEGFYTPGITRQQILQISLAVLLPAPVWLLRRAPSAMIALHLWAAVALYATMIATGLDIRGQGLTFDRNRDFTFGAARCEFLVDFPRRPLASAQEVALPDGPSVTASAASLAINTDQGALRLEALCMPNAIEGDGAEELAFSLERFALAYAQDHGLTPAAVNANWLQQAQMAEVTLEGCVGSQLNPPCQHLALRLLASANSLLILSANDPSWRATTPVESNFFASARKRAPDLKP